MKRLLIGLLVAVAVGAIVPAHAVASIQKDHYQLRGTQANAQWSTTVGTSNVYTYVGASTQKNGEELAYSRDVYNYDANGDFTGYSNTSADVTSGFAFKMIGHLASATLTAATIPAQTCTFDANWDSVGCVDTSIDLSVTWSGTGPISRYSDTERYRSAGYTSSYHETGTNREASAIGEGLGLADWASLAKNATSSMSIYHGE